MVFLPLGKRWLGERNVAGHEIQRLHVALNNNNATQSTANRGQVRGTVNNCPSYREPSWSKPKSYPWLMSFNMMASKNKSYASLFSGLSSTSGIKNRFSKLLCFGRVCSVSVSKHFFRSKFFSVNLLLWLFRETAIPVFEQLSRIQCCEVPGPSLCEKICKKIEARR